MKIHKVAHTELLLLDRLGFWKWRFFVVRGKLELSSRRETFELRSRTNKKRNRHMAPPSALQPGPHMWEASALTTTHPCFPFSRHGDVCSCGERKTGVPGEKPSEQDENQQQTQPRYGVASGIPTQAALVGGLPARRRSYLGLSHFPSRLLAFDPCANIAYVKLK